MNEAVIKAEAVREVIAMPQKAQIKAKQGHQDWHK